MFNHTLFQTIIYGPAAVDNLGVSGTLLKTLTTKEAKGFLPLLAQTHTTGLASVMPWFHVKLRLVFRANDSDEASRAEETASYWKKAENAAIVNGSYDTPLPEKQASGSTAAEG